MLHYHIIPNAGTQEWIVFIHGAGGSSRVWFRQLKTFKQHFNLLLIDLRGHGKSSSAEKKEKKRPYTFYEIAMDVIQVLDVLRLKSCHFMGISLGTIIIREIAGIDSKRVRSMIMAGAVIKFNVRSKALLKAADILKHILPYKLLYRLFARILMPHSCHKRSRNLFIREARKVTHREFLNWMTLSRELNSLLHVFWGDELPIPTIYLMGEYDYIFLSQVKLLLNTHNRYSRLEILPGAGHVCNVDASELFNKLVLSFLTECRKISQPKLKNILSVS